MTSSFTTINSSLSDYLSSRKFILMFDKKLNDKYDQHIEKKLNVNKYDIWREIKFNTRFQIKQAKSRRNWQEIQRIT